MNDTYKIVEALDLHIDLNFFQPEAWYELAEEETRVAVTDRVLRLALAELQDLCSVFARGTDAVGDGVTDCGWNWHEKLDYIGGLLLVAGR